MPPVPGWSNRDRDTPLIRYLESENGHFSHGHTLCIVLVKQLHQAEQPFMIRISREQLAERWALTYAQDGYSVRARGVPGLEAAEPHAGVTPDIEATNGNEEVVVCIIASPESLEDGSVERDLTALQAAREQGRKLHLIVAAECAHDIKERLEAWHVATDQIHVT